MSNWQKWSPWVIAEPNVKIKLTYDGYYYEWEGDIIGAENLKIFDREVNKSVQMHLSFLKPWKSKATTTFHLKPTPKGTTLTWSMKSKLPFFMIWMKRQMEDFIGMDYDRGLNMLKDLIETGNTNSSLKFKGQKKLYPLQYVGLKRTCPINEIGQNMEQDFTYLLDFLGENYSDQLKGKLMSIYHQWKINKNRVS